MQTQFKLTHNILPSNLRLFHWKRSTSPHCICGVNDTNLHFTVQCKLINDFWVKVCKYIHACLEVNFPISDREKYFGIDNPLGVTTIDSINFILLVARTFIWNEKRWGKPCHLSDFLPYLRDKLDIELSTKQYKIKPFLNELSELI